MDNKVFSLVTCFLNRTLLLVATTAVLLPSMTHAQKQAPEVEKPPPLLPILSAGAPTDVEYIREDLVSAGKEYKGDFRMLQMAAFPEVGLVIQQSHVGNLMDIDSAAYEIRNSNADAGEPEFFGNNDPANRVKTAFSGSAFETAQVVVGADGQPLDAVAFYLAHEWFAVGLPKGVTAERDLFRKQGDFAFIAEHDAQAGGSFTYVRSQDLLQGLTSRGLQIHLQSDEVDAGARIYGIAVERSQQYDAVYWDRRLTPVPGANNLPEDFTYDARHLYLSLGDRLLVIPFEKDSNVVTERQALHETIIAAFRKDLTADSTAFDIEALELLSLCSEGCYGIDITPSPYHSQVNWLWVGTRKGTIKVFSLRDPRRPDHITTIRTPLMTDPQLSDKRLIGLSLLRQEDPVVRAVMTDVQGKTYVYDVSRQMQPQLFQELSAAAMDDRALFLDEQPQGVGWPVRGRQTGQWRNYHGKATKRQLKLRDVEDEQETRLANVWKASGGYLAGFLSLEYRIQRLRPLILDTLKYLGVPGVSGPEYPEGLLSEWYAAEMQQVLSWEQEQPLWARYGAVGWAMLALPTPSFIQRLWSSKLRRISLVAYMGGAGFLIGSHEGYGMLLNEHRGELAERLEEITEFHMGFDVAESVERNSQADAVRALLLRYYTSRMLELMQLEHQLILDEPTLEITDDSIAVCLEEMRQLVAELGAMAQEFAMAITNFGGDATHWQNLAAFATNIEIVLTSMNIISAELGDTSADAVIGDQLTFALSLLVAATEPNEGEINSESLARMSEIVLALREKRQQLATLMAEKRARLAALVDETLDSLAPTDVTSIMQRVREQEAELHSDHPILQDPQAAGQMLTAIEEAKRLRTEFADLLISSLQVLDERQLQIIELRRQIYPQQAAADQTLLQQLREDYQQQVEALQAELLELRTAVSIARQRYDAEKQAYELSLSWKDVSWKFFFANVVAIPVEVFLRNRLPFLRSLPESTQTARVGSRTVRRRWFWRQVLSGYHTNSARALGVTYGVDTLLTKIRDNDGLRLFVTEEFLNSLEYDIGVYEARLARTLGALQCLDLYLGVAKE